MVLFSLTSAGVCLGHLVLGFQCSGLAAVDYALLVVLDICHVPPHRSPAALQYDLDQNQIKFKNC